MSSNNTGDNIQRRPYRVLHCPADVGGHTRALSRGEKALGVRSETLIMNPAPWLYRGDERIVEVNPKRPVKSILNRYSRFWKAMAGFDIIHFNFGSTLLDETFIGRFIELPLLRAAGKGIVVTYQGCDVRRRSVCVDRYETCACAEPDCYGGICTPQTDKGRLEKAKRLAQYADAALVLNPDLVHSYPGECEFFPYAIERPAAGEDRTPGRGPGPLLIVHAPTERVAKGTRYLEDAVARLLQRRPGCVELRIVERMSNDEAIRQMAQADLVVDQLLYGWYGGVAVEASYLGRPVGVYIREEDLEFVPPDMRRELPFIRLDIGELDRQIERMVDNPRMLQEAARRGASFAGKWHDKMAAASRMLRIYDRVWKNLGHGSTSRAAATATF